MEIMEIMEIPNNMFVLANESYLSPKDFGERYKQSYKVKIRNKRK